MIFPPNTTLGPYMILSKLGAGGMGEVYLARDHRLDRKVAIKVLLPAFAADAERLARFELETKSLAQLNHPNILQIYDTGTYEGSPYIVMEFLEGETLRQRMVEGPVPPRRAVELAFQITKGLAAAHEKGITHRDLKPENIFLLEDDHVKILDFGLAKLQAQPDQDSDVTQQLIAAAPCVTQPGIVVGTVGYLSPEQVVGRSADPRSDIFALGVVLWEMLHGSRPFHKDSAVETMHAILKEDPPELADIPGLPGGLARILHRCLEKNPKARFQSAQDLAFNLESLSLTTATQPVVSSVVGSARSQWLRGWLLAAASALVVFGTFWAGRATHKSEPVQFHRITYQKGMVRGAKFGPDGMTYVYAVSPDGGPCELRAGRIDGVGTRALGLPPGALILSISRAGEMALLLGAEEGGPGLLAKAPMGGGAPREVLADVLDADWGPDGKSLAVLRKGPEGRIRLEYPVGHLLYEAPESVLLMCPRVSPKGDRVAFSLLRSAMNGELRIVDLNGRSKVLAAGQCDTLAWSPKGSEILYSTVLKDDRQEIRLVNLSGSQRAIYSALGSLSIHDISSTGRVLVDNTLRRKGIRIRAAGDKAERDLSWLHSSDLADLSADGKMALILELREGEGPGGTYTRRVDGSEAVRLGDGDPLVLSPDSRWALVRSFDEKPELVLLPTGAGEPRRMPSGGVQAEWALFMRSGAQLLVGGTDAGKHFGCYLQDIATGGLQRLPWEVSLEAFAVISPEGDRVALGPMEGRIDIFSVKGGLVHTLRGFPSQEGLVQWSQDGRYLYSADLTSLPAKVFRVDAKSGQRSLWKDLAPEGMSGGVRIHYVSITPDGRSYAYSFSHVLTSDLYLMDGWN